MSYTQFKEKMEQVNKITELEYGEEEKEVSLTGEQGAALAQSMFPRRR